MVQKYVWQKCLFFENVNPNIWADFFPILAWNNKPFLPPENSWIWQAYARMIYPHSQHCLAEKNFLSLFKGFLTFLSSQVWSFLGANFWRFGNTNSSLKPGASKHSKFVPPSRVLEVGSCVVSASIRSVQVFQTPLSLSKEYTYTSCLVLQNKIANMSA